jgi:PBP1b-binding outer membrane lipoprotein LpoB
MGPKLMLLVVVVLALLVGGCSGLQAKAPMDSQMTSNAITATTIATATPVVARAYLPVAAQTLTEYYASATTNPFAYWFGKSTIYADATFMLDLQRTALDATEVAKRAVTISDALAVTAAKNEAAEIVNYNKARQGIK